MLEGLVAWVLNNYLGKYVENLNTDQLSIALLSGEVELENLPLKREALRQIGLPIEVKAGFIGKVRLQVPVRQIRTASWVIAIEQLYLVAGPICLEEYDSEVEEQALQEYKHSRLDSLEARWRANKEEDPGYYATSYSSWLSYGTSLVTNIIENLQLNIKDVHIRYEDDVTFSDGTGIALGVTIKGLTAQSCDASWVPGQTSWNLTDASYKLMELDGLSVYWKHLRSESDFLGRLSLGELAMAMSDSARAPLRHLLSPVSARAHVKRDRSEKPLRSTTRPRIVLDIRLDEVPMSITDEQYGQMVKCVRELEEIDRRRRQRRCRPLVPISESPREWWKYAARCHIGNNTLNPKPSWSDVAKRAKENVAYVEAYSRLLDSPTSILPPETKLTKERIELERSYEDVRSLRELAMSRVRPSRRSSQEARDGVEIPPARGILVQWFPQWWGWHSKNSPTSGQAVAAAAAAASSSSTFDGELLDVLADTIDDNDLLRRDAVFGQFNFVLSRGAISLCTAATSGPPRKLMELQFERVKLAYESRPRSGSHAFSISLGALYLRDFLTEKSMFPILIQPQVSPEKLVEPLFELVYEKRPLNSSADNSLRVNSRSLDIVYNPQAIKWLASFVGEPHRDSSTGRIQAMKRRTRRRLMKNWEEILEGEVARRSSWDLRFNVSAPQILLVESFVEPNGAVVVVDFGRLRLTNSAESDDRLEFRPGSPASDDDDDDERFETPCSTPPGSQENGSVEDHPGLSETAFHRKLYDRYALDLADLQVLVAKVKDNWKHARTRGMSSLHVLERFNISLEVERRVVGTADPRFPSVTISGNLPRLVVHVNEGKVEAMRKIYRGLSSRDDEAGRPRAASPDHDRQPDSPRKPRDRNSARAIILRFVVERMTFELQSRGRSVAELQVSGVKAALSKRPADLSASLSVHGLLLVDAMQEFGPDFELLVASHRHVGMDSVSGSLRDSEPTSPTSPGKPTTSPVALSRGLSSLAPEPDDPSSPRNNGDLDSEALIVVEVVLVEEDRPSERLRLAANVRFNNLDVIANQETIVELMGFAGRIFPGGKSGSGRSDPVPSFHSEPGGGASDTITEITFDFRRLNVLLLRAVLRDGHSIGRKIATATMSDARIRAILANEETSVLGSLGGLQVLDQTDLGKIHQRIVSVGRDPIADPARRHPQQLTDQPEALRFAASTNDSLESRSADVSVRVASVWYTHAPHLLSELRSCADEFERYLGDLARHIGAAATDMAIGLVNPEDWTTAAIEQRRRSPSLSVGDGDDDPPVSRLRLDVVLDSPVLVLPRSPASPQVFVAHLGAMSLRHEPSTDPNLNEHKLSLEVRDMNLYSLDVSDKIDRPVAASASASASLPMRAEDAYSCRLSGKPVLHDTVIKVTMERDVLLERETPENPILNVHGLVVTPLRVSLSRGQYEQLLDTMNRLLSVPEVESKARENGSYPRHLVNGEKFDVFVKVSFELPTLSVELKRDLSGQPLVELSMRDLLARYEKLRINESSVQVALRSLLVEDLLRPIGSRHRYMMRSSAPASPRLPVGVSGSCPDLALGRRSWKSRRRGSLPDRLETDILYGTIPSHWRKPPPSPGALTTEENLVLFSIATTASPEVRRLTYQRSVDFNCLDLIISVESWMIVLDFFSIGTSPANENPRLAGHHPATTVSGEREAATEIHSETDIEVRSLTLVLVRSDREIARANVSNAGTRVSEDSRRTRVSGSLGSVSLLDLTPHGRFYRERFSSTGRKALNFRYSSYLDSRKMPHDARLELRMSSVNYVHTRRFVAELEAFFRHFYQLRAVTTSSRNDETTEMVANERNARLSLELHAGAPVILLPVSSTSDQLIILDLGELTARNSFERSTTTTKNCLLDVILVELVNMDVYAARRMRREEQRDGDVVVVVGGFPLRKLGPSLLTEKCHLRLRVERNLDVHVGRDIPDIGVNGTLSTMNCALDPAQYTLIRGLLAYNIGENLDDLGQQPTRDSGDCRLKPDDASASVWTKSCIALDIVNVTLKLHPNHGIAALACVNFIKSRLTLDSLSDGSQDIDLVSKEILVTDTRFQDEPVNKRSNVFANVLQPLMNFDVNDERVQAEIHHRRRRNNSSTTILLHSMRLTAIIDWWEAVRDFLVLNAPEPEPISGVTRAFLSQEADDNVVDAPAAAAPFDLKLNITDSELVVVENTSQWDTNAVILKCTAVVAYRSNPIEGEKPLSCNLSHCELFSCILGMEEETALSIIDPVGASLELADSERLEIQLQPLSVKLSYHDVTMFARMLRSLPKQTLWARRRSREPTPPANAKSHVAKLLALGFAETDCEAALDRCNGQLEDAALWLTRNAVPRPDADSSKNGLFFRSLVVETSRLRICVIDDCLDADVPLLELALADLCLRQELEGGGYCGSLRATLAVDYYNRVLSGWEPFIEPWKALVEWQQTLGGNVDSLNSRRLQMSVDSEGSVNVNATSTLVELVALVKRNWTRDYYLSNRETICKTSFCPQAYRRRSPFVPFALKNETGSRLWFKTYIAVADDEAREISVLEDRDDQDEAGRDETWVQVPTGDTAPFDFEERGKLRHHSTHVVRRHQVAVLVEGWRPVKPVTIDRVGVYFRHADLAEGNGLLKTRLVFDVQLEGSARKLVTVRSALRVLNRLSCPVDVKLEKLAHNRPGYRVPYAYTSGKNLQVPANSVVSVPLTHTSVKMTFRPLHCNKTFRYSVEPVEWSLVKKASEIIETQILCRANLNDVFRICVAVRRDNYPIDASQWLLPAHTISLLPPLTLTNLLPHELLYEVATEKGRIAPGHFADLHNVNVGEQLELVVQLDGYPGIGALILGQMTNSFVGRLRLSDSAGRILYLHASVVVEKGSAVRINVTAPYWIINKTGLPLVFRQEGVGLEAAGQFEEHEKARMVAPLLFSFSDEEASRTLAVRVGTAVHPNGVAQWSQHFHLQPGVQVHRLRVTLRDGRPDVVYLIGVATRAARGKYRPTTVITLSPRYQLHNKSSYTLELAQKSFTTTVSHPDAQATYITAMPDCHMPFHWPRLDKDQLLCVRIIDVPNCMWSGGIILDGNHSLTINIRDAASKMHFLRVDVVLQESTYFIVFTDAETMPPPIRVDNFSEVPLVINQTAVLESLQWTVRPHCSVPYALDEPTEQANLTVTAPGGVTLSYDLNVLGENRGLTYENFIYIAFTGTFKSDGDLSTGEGSLDPLDVETQRLVLEAGPGGWVALRRKQYGARSQLWRMSGDGQLQHEGSSPPRDKHSRTPDTVLVLDIAGPAPQPFTYCALALRRPDPRRRSTQTWRFTDDGRLCCAHQNMCVQSKDGFMGLHEGSEAVLGPQIHSSPPPIEQRVGRQRLRPGSGFLSVRVTTDGPTRVLQVLDINERKRTFALLEERDWSHIASTQRPTQVDAREENSSSRELQLNVRLPAGLGLSIVSRKPAEELLFARLAGIALELVQSSSNVRLNLSVSNVQIDNQLFEAQCSSVLYISRTSRSDHDERPAIEVAAEKLASKNQNAEIYKHLVVSVKPLCVHLEERLILKLAAFVGTGRSELDVPVDENDFKAQRFISEVSAAHAKRYYFGALKLVPSQVKLSVLTTTKLPPHLQSIKRKLGLTLIKFEDATIELEPFIKKHPFESSQFLIHSIIRHYKDELKWQAAVILGSVDFLGNPLGFVNDVSEGVSGLIYEGSVKTLVKNVTHGISNSAAKVTESLSDGLGRVIMDERHEEARQKIRANNAGSSDHLVAGLKGLGFGLLGGMTSIFKQTYDGAANEGFPGFFAGFGKGVVGTITKPVVGVLDLATETATAVRETSRSAHRTIPKRDRLPRVASGPAGLLPPYNAQQAEGQEFLYIINERDYSELFVAYECLCSGTENLRVLVSNVRVRVISGGTKSVVTEVSLADLLHCQPIHKIEADGTSLHYIELTARTDTATALHVDGTELLRRPKVRCDSEDVAKWVSQQINYAKGMHGERSLTLMSSDNLLDNIRSYN